MKTRGAVKKTPIPKKGGPKTPTKDSLEGVDVATTSPEQVLNSESLRSPLAETKSDVVLKMSPDSRIEVDIDATGFGDLSTPKTVKVSEKNGNLLKSSSINDRLEIEGSKSATDADADVAMGDIQEDKVEAHGGEENGAEFAVEVEDSEVDEIDDEVDDEVEDSDEDEVEEGIQKSIQVDKKVEDAKEEIELEEYKEQEICSIAKEDEEQILLESQDSHPIPEGRKLKSLEVFVGGIDKDMTNEELRTVFEKVGNVLEVRMNRSSQTGKNKGYAFVRFAESSEAKKAVEEFHDTEISGKICRVTPSLENDILYLGNISKEWKKENLTDALSKYKIENLESVNLLEDSHNEGKNRGYAFLEFTSHKEALKAFTRLRQRDIVFGADRSAKVAWSQPFHDPDEQTMAQVKKVFVDGMPPAWDRERVTEHFGKYGEIERIVLGSDKASTKRKDFGFIEYTTREAAMACIEAVDKTEVGEGEQKVMLKVRLSKPLLKIKSWRGEIRGNYPIVKSTDAVRSSRRDGNARNGKKSSGGRHAKSGHSHSLGDVSRGVKLDHKKRSPLGGGSASHRRTKFSIDSASHRKKSKFTGPHLERRTSHREKFSSRDGLSPREMRRDAYKHRREGREYAEAASGRKRGFSDLEHDPSYVEFPLSSRSRARFVHPEELAVPVGGSQYAHIPYHESSGRAPIGRVPQYPVGQAMVLPAAPVQPYALYDSLSSAANVQPSYTAGGYAYGSVYSNGTDIARGAYASSPYPPPGASQYSVPRANLGPYY